MRYRGFEIKNFKGIKHVCLDLSDAPASNIHLLVGLNESGKTTILEALSFFYDNITEPGFARSTTSRQHCSGLA
jgi:AAA15 family ATPase/GTPase